MKKGFWIGFVAIFTVTIIIGALIKFWDSPDIDKIISLVGVIISAAAILFVVRNTNRQIENQNKESHRPYIDIINIERIKHNYLRNYDEKIEFSNEEQIPHFLSKRYSVDFNNEKNVNMIIEIQLRNIGYGVANNLHFWSIHSTTFFNYIKGHKEGNHFSTINLARDQKVNLRVYIDFQLKEVHYRELRDNICFLIFYSDLLGNIYSQFVNIYLVYPFDNNKQDVYLNYTFYSQESSDFYRVLKNLEVDYDKELEKYKKKCSK